MRHPHDRIIDGDKYEKLLNDYSEQGARNVKLKEEIERLNRIIKES